MKNFLIKLVVGVATLAIFDLLTPNTWSYGLFAGVLLSFVVSTTDDYLKNSSKK